MRGVQQTYEEPPESTTSQSPSSAREPETSAEARRDWGDAPDTRDFIGGAAELNTVRTWILMFEVTYWRPSATHHQHLSGCRVRSTLCLAISLSRRTVRRTRC